MSWIPTYVGMTDAIYESPTEVITIFALVLHFYFQEGALAIGTNPFIKKAL